MLNLHLMKLNGQSAWLNYLRRSFIDSGELRRAVDSGIAGITSSPAVFDRAITCSSDYDQALQRLIKTGMPVREIYLALVVDDIQRAADVLHPIFEESAAQDGYVTVELDPFLAHDAVGTVAEARHLLALINRPNVMVEVPATQAGIEALRNLIKDGVNVNATHIFSIGAYEKVAEAYVQGITAYLESHSVWRQNPSSVASLSINRIDGVVDDLLEKTNHQQFQGKAAIALAKMVYLCFRKIFSGKEWEALARKGAWVQRPKWTRTTPRSFKYPLVHYIEPLVGADTVCTLSPATYNAVRDYGVIKSSISEDLDQAQLNLSAITRLDIDLESIGLVLQQESLSYFSRYYQAMIESVIKKRNELDFRWHRVTRELGSREPGLRDGLRDITKNGVMFRIWSQDHTVWSPDPSGIINRLGWLHVLDVMEESISQINNFIDALKDESFNSVLLLGTGGASLAAKIFVNSSDNLDLSLDSRNKGLNLHVLDTIDTTNILVQDRNLDLEKTLILVADKSGDSIETMSLFRYYYNRMIDEVGIDQVGDRFAAITDPASNLALTAEKHCFRKIFLNDSKIGSFYNPLSYFGLIPAAVVGLDISQLIARAQAMACNAASCNRPIEGDNQAAVVGTILGQLALEGRKMVFVSPSPAFKGLSEWIVQLLCASTSKEGHGIIALNDDSFHMSEPLNENVLNIYLKRKTDVHIDLQDRSMMQEGQPFVAIEAADRYDLGGLIFLWQMAAAVAAYHLGVQPFSEPLIEHSSRKTQELITQLAEQSVLPILASCSPSGEELGSFLSQAKSGDYVVIQSYLPLTAEIAPILQTIRSKLQDSCGLLTTVDMNPGVSNGRKQHYLGKFGKGSFIQLIYEPGIDIPIPDETGLSRSSLTFNQLQRILSMEMAQGIQRSNRPLLRFNLQNDITGGLNKLAAVETAPVTSF